MIRITPAAEGWSVGGSADGEPARLARTMEEAAASLPADASVSLSLPVSAVLLERMKLPATDREELGGMVVLQLEKTLPYSGEELTSGHDIIRQGETESDVLAIAVSNEQLDAICEPLRGRRMLPAQVGIYASQLAARYPEEEVLALVYREGDSTVLGIAQSGKLVAAHAYPTTNRTEFLTELPRLMLAAELEGTPINFTKIVVERELAGWIDGLKSQLGDARIDLMTMDLPLEQGAVNLVPAGWTQEKRKLEQSAKVRDWLALAGVIYLCLLLAAAAYIIWLQRQVGQVNALVVQASPTVNDIGSRKARWTALAPATDPNRYAVELLQQINQSIPNEDLHVTDFEQQSPSEFEITGEAPSLDVANQYLNGLQDNAALKAFHITGSPPTVLSNDHAAFVIDAAL